ncbi:MAG: rod-binding protein [Planctomycetaceae bacterium]|jgi:Rod binding domain-containing protein|nr:rod-binding protein [Planctomycetaceae bacterium]
MINSITNPNIAYAAQMATDTAPKVSPVLKEKSGLDVFQRSDGSTATRLDIAKQPPGDSLADAQDKQFREVLHQFIGQTLFGQMLKSMRATQEKNPFFHGGQSEEIYQSMLDMQLTEEMTKSSSRSISEPMYKLMKAPKAKT